MKVINIAFLSLLIMLVINLAANAQSQKLKLIFIRHGEKSIDGDNLNCQGFNRSVMLPSILFRKFGKPDLVYIPRIQSAEATKHMRMLQTITPFAVKYDLSLNSNFEVDDYSGTARSLIREKGTVLIVWEHQGIPEILKNLGINSPLTWPPDDFDSIWIVTFKKGTVRMTKEKELLSPAKGCPF
jgi:hypothetical protein